MIEHKFPLDVDADDLSPWLSPNDVAAVSPLPGWHNSIFRIDTRSGERFVLRVHIPDEGPDFVEPTLRVATAYAQRLPFVHAPIPARDGELWKLVSGRTATLWPFVHGRNGDEAALDGAVAARCLGELHSVGSSALGELEGIELQPWSDMDWRRNGRWNLEEAERFLTSNWSQFKVSTSLTEVLELLRTACGSMQAALQNLDSSQMPTLPLHGDFYPHNLIVGAAGQVIGLVDWDESRIDWRVWDLANALLEFCAGPAGMNFDSACARNLIAAYETAAPGLSAAERNSLPLLIKARKLDEFLYSIAETYTGAAEDWEYLDSSLTGLLQIQDLSSI